MTEDIDEIRRQRQLKLAQTLSKLDGDESERQEVMESLPWSFRYNTNTGFCEILQSGNMVAITQDEKFADQVCDVFNRMTLISEYTEGLDESNVH